MYDKVLILDSTGVSSGLVLYFILDMGTPTQGSREGLYIPEENAFVNHFMGAPSITIDDLHDLLLLNRGGEPIKYGGQTLEEIIVKYIPKAGLDPDSKKIALSSLHGAIYKFGKFNTLEQ